MNELYKLQQKLIEIQEWKTYVEFYMMLCGDVDKKELQQQLDELQKIISEE